MFGRNRIRIHAAVAIAALCWVAAAAFFSAARALPRYSARYGQNCTLCHVNPTGGGMRNTYAAQYLVPDEIAMTRSPKSVTEAIDPEISKSVTIGADFRTLFVYSDDDAANSNFFQMQGDVYLNFQLNDRMSLYFDRGMTRSYELFATAYLFPEGGYLKAGRFVPAFGWRFDDHTMYVRSELGFFPPNHTDVGVEFGVFPEHFEFQAAVLNGNRGNVSDSDRNLAAVLRGAWRFNLAGMAFSAGVSGATNRNATGKRDDGGAFGMWEWRGLTYVGELDWSRTRPSAGGHTTAMIWSNEVAIPIRQGLDVMGTYDFHDPDWNLKTGSRSRYGAGLYTLVVPGAAFQGMVRSIRFDNGGELAGDDYVEALAQIHFLF